MVQVIELTEKEQLKSFMKMKKKKLAKMLIASNQLRQKLMDGKPASFKFADSVFENMSKSIPLIETHNEYRKRYEMADILNGKK